MRGEIANDFTPFFMKEKSFIDHLQYEKRYSQHTILAYESDLEQFWKYLSDQYEMEEAADVSHMHVRSWVVSLIEQGLSSTTINRKISCLKAFFKYLKRTEVIETNPMSKVLAPKMGKRLPVFVEEKNMDSLFDRKLFASDFEGHRDLLVIELLYNTGIRLSELIGLQEKNVDLQSGQFKVLGKRNKERIIPISPKLGAIISDYISLKKELNLSNQNDHLIVKSDGVKMYEKLVYRIVNKYLGLVTTMKKKSPHVLRHTFATHMLNKGADLGAIKELLGHSSLAATQLYTHNSIEHLKLVHQQAHPKG